VLIFTAVESLYSEYSKSYSEAIHDMTRGILYAVPTLTIDRAPLVVGMAI